MGASPDEIDRRMKQTRGHVDEHLGVLDPPAARDQVRRYATIVAVVLGAAVVAGAGVLVYRRVRGRTRIEQLQDTLAEGFKDLPDSLRRIAPGRWVLRKVG